MAPQMKNPLDSILYHELPKTQVEVNADFFRSNSLEDNNNNSNNNKECSISTSTSSSSSSIVRLGSVDEERRDETGSHFTSEFEGMMKFAIRQQLRSMFDCVPQVIATSSSSDSEDSIEESVDEAIELSLRPIPFWIYPSKPILRKSVSSSTTPSPAVAPKRVRYDGVTVHFHSVSLGDSPSVSKGPPVAMTWERLHTACYSSLDKYESERPELRGKKKIRLSVVRREKILARSGVSPKRVQLCMETIESLKREQEANDREDSAPSSSSSSCTPLPGSSSRRPRPSLANPHELLWFDWICSSSSTLPPSPHGK